MGQKASDASSPWQPTSSSQMGPVPCPKAANERATAPIYTVEKYSHNHPVSSNNYIHVLSSFHCAGLDESGYDILDASV